VFVAKLDAHHAPTRIAQHNLAGKGRELPVTKQSRVVPGNDYPPSDGVDIPIDQIRPGGCPSLIGKWHRTKTGIDIGPKWNQRRDITAHAFRDAIRIVTTIWNPKGYHAVVVDIKSRIVLITKAQALRTKDSSNVDRTCNTIIIAIEDVFTKAGVTT